MSDPDDTLDPSDWEETRALAHRMVDDAVDYLRDIREAPVWRPMPDAVFEAFRGPVPEGPTDLAEVYDTLARHLLPHPMGNIHPRFWMWYMGSSNFTGALGDFLAAVIGSNLGGGNHAAALVDQQVTDWLRQMMRLPAGASGTLVSGGSMANLIGLAVARNAKAGVDVRAEGVAAIERPLRFYGSDQLHGCHQKAVETLGLGSAALRKVASDADFRMDLGALRAAIEADRAAGCRPACVIATAGTVNTGAIDDLQRIAALCHEQDLWMHVDGCIGALIAIAPENGWRVAGLEHADSVALDPHKWLHAPFEVGCALVRDADAHLRTFSLSSEYLQRMERGIAAAPMLHDFGLQTSRGFRALKVWMSLKEHGVAKFGRLIDRDIALARQLTELVEKTQKLALAVPTSINIVCYRYDPGGLDAAALERLNVEIMLRMQENGTAAVSDTTVHGEHCLRVALNNHRTRPGDLQILVDETLRQGDAVMAG